MGLAPTECSDTIVISSLPYTASTSDTCYCLSGNLSSATNGINVTGNDLLIDMDVDTIDFGTGNGNANYGIYLTTSARNVHVKQGQIRHNGSGTDNYCLQLYAPDSILIDSVDMTIMGEGGSDNQCIYGAASIGSPGTFYFEIDGGNYANNCTTYTSRYYYDGSVIKLGESNWNWGTVGFHYKIHNITITDGHGQGIVVYGKNYDTRKCKVFIYDNDITVDGYNSSGSWCNPYCILTDMLAPGSRIYRNTVGSGTTYAGSRGIAVQASIGEDTAWIDCDSNTINIHEGPNTEVGEASMSTYGLRLRLYSGGGDSIDYVRARWNTVTVTADTSQATDAYGIEVSGIRISGNTYDSVEIYGNYFKAISTTAGTRAYAVVFDAYDGQGLNWHHNRVESDFQCYKWAEYYGGAQDVIITGDTVNFLSPLYADSAVYALGYNNANCSNNDVRDIVYEGNAKDSMIYCQSGGTRAIDFEELARIYVYGSNGLGVVNASAWFVNGNGDTVFTGNTGDSGIVSGYARYRQFVCAGADNDFNDHLAGAQKDGDSSTTSAIKLKYNYGSSSVILSSTAGTIDFGNGASNYLLRGVKR